MDTTAPPLIPCRAQTLEVLRLMSDREPILMLTGDDDGFGTRWTCRGQQVQPVIAGFLMGAGYIADVGRTEFGARRLALTAEGHRFRQNGIQWWASLNLLQRLKVMVFG